MAFYSLYLRTYLGLYPNPFGDDRAAIRNATVSSTQNDRRWIGQFNATGGKVGRSYPTVN